MTIVERIQLHKLGYTKEEINELVKENYNPEGLTNPPADPPVENVVETVEEPAVIPEQQTDPNEAILKAIQGLTATIQQSNIIQSRQPEQPKETAEDILSTLL